MSEKEKRPARVLVADSIYQFRNAYAALMQQAGFEVATAADEREILTALSLEDYDVLFLDVSFQDLVGRLGRLNTSIPIVGLYGGPNEEWTASGADAVLHKRDALGEGIKTINAIMSGRL